MTDETQEAIEAMRRRYRDEALAAVSRAKEEGEARGRAAALEEVKPKLEKERANTKEELGRLRDQVKFSFEKHCMHCWLEARTIYISIVDG